MVQVHGHYQCPVCKTNALPCCDGDDCNNFLLNGEISVMMKKDRETGTNSIAENVKD
jgi:hypothetical protein